MTADTKLVQRAVELALEAVAAGGGPFGALIALDGEIVAEGRNQVEPRQDPTAHAEMEAIRAATSRLGTRWLRGHTLVSSAEPCPMCLAAAYWAGIERVVYSTSVERTAEWSPGGLDLYRGIRAPDDAVPISVRELRVEGDDRPFRHHARGPASQQRDAPAADDG